MKDKPAKYCSHRCWSRTRVGPTHPRWKGGTAGTARVRAMGRREYKEWRDAVFIRDAYTCQLCGEHCGNGHEVYLNAHHVKPWANHPDRRYDVDNGMTLCRACHLTVHHPNS